jgi:hypothetical protein
MYILLGIRQDHVGCEFSFKTILMQRLHSKNTAVQFFSSAQRACTETPKQKRWRSSAQNRAASSCSSASCALEAGKLHLLRHQLMRCEV